MDGITESGLLESLVRLESMLGGKGVAKSQITTGPGSSQGNMTDMHQEQYGDSWSDGIAGDGTDYKGRGKKASKANGEGDEEPYPEEEDDEKDRRKRRAESDEEEEKSLPTAGAPLKTKKPATSGQTIEPGAPGMTKSNDGLPYTETPVSSTPKPPPEGPTMRGTEFSGSDSSPLFGRRSGGAGEAQPHRIKQPASGGSPQADVTPNPERSTVSPKGGGAKKGMQPSVGAGEPSTGGGPGPSVGTGAGIRRSIEIEEDGELRRGIEVSEFMFFLKKSMEDTFFDMEQRLSQRIHQQHGARGEFARGLAEAVVGINKSLNFQEAGVSEEEAAPAHAAKSVMSEEEVGQSLHKSLQQGIDMRKSILNELEELFQKGDGQVNALDIIRFDTSQQLKPEVRALLKSVNS